jgi:hypothetical protein
MQAMSSVICVAGRTCYLAGMRRVEIRSDLPHDECVSDVMEALISQGLPHEIAAHMAEDIVNDYEARRYQREVTEMMVRSIQRSHRLQRWHLWSIIFCMILAVANAISVWWLVIEHWNE